MAAHESAIADIVSNIHTYAGDKQLPQIFHAFMLAIVFARPANPLEHISQEASKMKGKAVIEEPPLPGREMATEAETKQYLDQHRIHDTLEELFTSVLFNKPSDPFSFIEIECKRLQAIRGMAKGAARLYTAEDLKAMHSLYDPSKKGTITPGQVTAAFRNMGLNGAPLSCPEAVDADTFVKLGLTAIESSGH